MTLPDPKAFFNKVTHKSRRSKLERAMEKHEELKPWIIHLMDLRLEGVVKERNAGRTGNKVLSFHSMALEANKHLGTTLTHHDLNYYWRLHFEERLNELTRSVEDASEGDEGSEGSTGEAFPPPGLDQELARTDPVSQPSNPDSTGANVGGLRGRTLSP